MKSISILKLQARFDDGISTFLVADDQMGKNSRSVAAVDVRVGDYVFADGEYRRVSKSRAVGSESVERIECKTDEEITRVSEARADLYSDTPAPVQPKNSISADGAPIDAAGVSADGLPALTIKGAFIRPERFDMYSSLCRFRLASLTAEKARAACAADREQIEANHPDAAFMTCSDDVLYNYALELSGKGGVKYTPAQAYKTVTNRGALVSAEETLSQYAGLAPQYAALEESDKAKIEINVLRNAKNVASLPIRTLYTGKKDSKGKDILVDYMPAIKSAYQCKSGGRAAVADTVRGLAFSVFGRPSYLCYGLDFTCGALKAADSGQTLSHFIAQFSAGITIETDTKNIRYTYNSSSTKYARELLGLEGVMCDSGQVKLIDFKDEAEAAAAEAVYTERVKSAAVVAEAEEAAERVKAEAAAARKVAAESVKAAEAEAERVRASAEAAAAVKAAEAVARVRRETEVEAAEAEAETETAEG